MTLTQTERERISNCSICKHLSDLEFEDFIRGTGKLPEKPKIRTNRYLQSSG